MHPKYQLADRRSRRALLHQITGYGLAAALPWPYLAVAPQSQSDQLALPMLAWQDADRLTVMLHHNQFDLDPHVSFADASVLFLGIFEMLVQLKGESADEFAPMLADRWESNPEGSSYTFYLSPDAAFHDGTPCDASAVKASFARLLGLGAGPSSIVRRFVQDPEQIAVLDRQTIRFDLGIPQPLFLAAMASPFSSFVVNPRLVAAHQTDDDPWAHEWLMQNANGAGTGPYMVTEHLPGEQTTLTRFDGYHRGWAGPHFAQAVLRVVGESATRRQLLERHEVDIVTRLLTPEDIAVLANDPDLHVETYDTFDVGWIVMNAPQLRTPDVRRGFSYAFPYANAIAGAEGGLRTRTGPLPSGMRGYDPHVFLYPTDLARARELILSGGFQEGDAFSYVYLAGSESSQAIAQLFDANLRAIGFSLELIEVDQSALFDIGFGELPAEERPAFLGSWGWYPDYNDPWSQLAPSFLRSYTEGGEGLANAGLWSNNRFEQIMAEARVYANETRLIELMKEAQRILTVEDPPCIYLGQQRYVTVLGADVGGFVPNPLYLNMYRFYDLYPN